jgi:SAM-dependent methyltransferase
MKAHEALAMTEPTSRPLRNATERLVALSYGVAYDAIVRGFRPYQALLDEIVSLVARSGPAAARATQVLDVSCGTGTVAGRLAREGYSVTAVDAVGHLVDVARRRYAGVRNLSFQHLDIATGRVPGEGDFDALVSMHTLYWHPKPQEMLAACRRALRPGGRGVFLTYTRPARVGQMFREIRAREGVGQAIHALRWLVPTVAFEALRKCDCHYLSRGEFRRTLTHAGFEIVEMRETFVDNLSLLAWVRARDHRR